MKLFLLLVALGLLASMAFAEDPAARDARMKWWREARFGMFIHWGLYAIPAGKWGNQSGHGEWIRTTAQIPLEEYNQLQPQFNPTKFDAAAWMKLANRAGMKYVVITSKHHDGFGLFDSKLTDWDVMGSPFKRDIMKEIAQAARKNDVVPCWYHSIMDWHHPDYLPRRDWEKNRSAEGADFARFEKYLHGQVTELLTNYGDIGVMWFDGEWESTWNHELGKRLDDLCRKLQPNVIVNNRVDVGRGGMAGMTEAGYRGDFGTPEQEVPAEGLVGVDWESCITMNGHWGFNAADKNYKSSKELIELLVDVVSKGGNLLLNVGPRADGTLPPESVERLEAMGRWMDINGEAIYGTTASQFATNRDWKSTSKGKTLYFFLREPMKQLVVPGVGGDVEEATVLGGVALEPKRVGTDLHIPLGVFSASPVPVVKVTFKQNPVVFRTPVFETASGDFVDEGVFRVKERAGVELRYAVDDDPTVDSPKVEGPIRMRESGELRVAQFDGGKRVSSVAVLKAKMVLPREGMNLELKDGLSARVFRGAFDKCADLTGQPQRQIWERVTLGTLAGEENVGLELEGYVFVEKSAMVTFKLTSDDGSMLWIGDEVAIDNDGLHSAVTKTGSVALGAGWHPIRLRWFNRTGGAELKLSAVNPNGESVPLRFGTR
jgi:alpha-L-fucosidase